MKYLNKPRQRHYMLGHEAFRQMCEHDPHQFFEIMASSAQLTFIKELVSQVELNTPEDSTLLNSNQIKVTTSMIDNKPLMIIEMPTAKALVECVYVGIVCMIDINSSENTPRPEIRYFTLEIAENDDGESRMFCMWDEDSHYNLAEMDKATSSSDFALVIKQKLDQMSA